MKIVTNMRNILIAWNLQQFLIIFKKSTDIFSMIVVSDDFYNLSATRVFVGTNGECQKYKNC